MSVHEVIDLTTESPDQPASNTLDPSARDDRKLKKRRKSSNSKSGTPEEVPSNLNLNDSNEGNAKLDRSSKRKRVHETPKSNERRRRRSHAQKHDPREPDKSDSVADLFFVDLPPTAIPSIPVSQELISTTIGEDEKVGKLLLPSHVTVFGDALVEIISQPLSNSDDDEFIKYLDYEDTRNVPRYFDEPPDEKAALERTVCKNCGAEGDHRTSACTIKICLTCGVRNEHSTRSCPISKVCFTCGMKGHINANCPNRHSGRNYTSMRNDDCARCSSTYHKTNECPTWWRIYEYLTGEDQTRTFSRRLSKKDLKLGEGGEGYVADDEWCYNCGNVGHWGDDCQDRSKTRSPEEYSAFGNNNVITGPFYDPSHKPKSPPLRSRIRNWERAEDKFKDAPGRQGRMKSMAALEKKSRQVEDDPDDWFGNNNNLSKLTRTAPSHPPREPKKMSFGRSFKDDHQYAPPPKRLQGLLPRLSDDYLIYRPQVTNRRDESRRSRRSRNEDNNRHRREERREERPASYRQDIPTGPRYRGGYDSRH